MLLCESFLLLYRMYVQYSCILSTFSSFFLVITIVAIDLSFYAFLLQFSLLLMET